MSRQIYSCCSQDRWGQARHQGYITLRAPYHPRESPFSAPLVAVAFVMILSVIHRSIVNCKIQNSKQVEMSRHLYISCWIEQCHLLRSCTFSTFMVETDCWYTTRVSLLIEQQTAVQIQRYVLSKKRSAKFISPRKLSHPPVKNENYFNRNWRKHPANTVFKADWMSNRQLSTKPKQW